jgi:hypothetical protein
LNGAIADFAEAIQRKPDNLPHIYLQFRSRQRSLRAIPTHLLVDPGIGRAGTPSRQSVLNGEFSFKPVDFVSKPPLEDLFALGGIQGGDRPALRIQRDMVTRQIFGFARLWNVLHENTFRALMGTGWIAEIQAG